MQSLIYIPFTVPHLVVSAEDPDQYQGSHPKQCHPSNIVYGPESTVLLEPHDCGLESFVIHCLRNILGVLVREKKLHTIMHKMAKQMRISSIFSQHRLHFLGHLSMMLEDQLPRQLFVCAPVGGKHLAGGQKQ